MQRYLLGDRASAAQADALLVEQTKLLYAGLPSAVIINTLLALILVSMQSAVISTSRLLVWLALISTALLARAALAVAWRRSGPDAANCAPRWIRRFRISVIATGIVWGMAAELLFPAGDVTYQVSLALVLAGMSAGAITLLAIDRVSMLGFLVPTLVPLIVRFWVEGSAVSPAMGAMVALFLFFTAANATQVGRSIYQTFRLRIKAEEQEQVLRQSETRLNQAQRSAHIGNWELDLVSNHLHWSDEIYRIFEIDQATFGASYEAFLNVIHPDDRNRVNQAYTDSLAHRAPYDIVHRLQFADGRIKFVHEHCETLFDADGKAIRSLGTVQDITEQKLAENTLRESEARYRAVSYTASDAIITADSTGNIVGWNRGAEIIFGYTEAEASGQPLTLLMPQRYRDRHLAGMNHVLSGGEHHIIGSGAVELEGLRKNGSEFPLEISMARWVSDDELFFTGIIRDITERKKDEELIRNLAFYDTLTQLPNRRLLNDRLKLTMAASKRSGRYAALMFLDLDNFKPLNDTYGHDAGDLLLVEVARRLGHCVRETDTIARFGGDEFVVIYSVSWMRIKPNPAHRPTSLPKRSALRWPSLMC